MSMHLRWATLAAAGLMLASGTGLSAQVVNPCAPKVKNPCTPSGTAAAPGTAKPEVDPALVMRPQGTSLARGDRARLIRKGKALFASTKLSSNGLACESCHTNNENFAASFAMPYPHTVAMARDKGGVAQVHLDEMVQFCMVVAMQTKPLPWQSQELAALTAYTGELQSAFRDQSKGKGAARANPCARSNPCAPRK